MRSRIIYGMVLSALVMGIAGCGGSAPATPQAVSRVALPPDQTVGGFQFTLNIPYNVTAQTDSSGNVTSYAVDLYGASGNYQIVRSYTPATATADGTLTVAIIEPAGFTAGQYVAIRLDITPGVDPSTVNAADFTLSNVIISNLNGSIRTTADGVTTSYSVDITQ